MVRSGKPLPVVADEMPGALRRTEEVLVHLARLNALALLGERRIAGKVRVAARAAELMEEAARLDSFRHQYYTVPPALVRWFPAANPAAVGIAADGTVDWDLLEREIASLESAAAGTVAELIREATADPLLAPEAALLAQTVALLPQPSGGAIPVDWDGWSGDDKAVVRALVGPGGVDVDPVFAPTYSVMDRAVPAPGASAAEAAPYLWSLAVREAMAAELCALTMAEYDGLPLAFYRDMAKQAWDEARHAAHALDSALALLPEAEADPRLDRSLRDVLRTYRERGTGLPIPRERSLYEAIANASLTERLVLLHHDTETPAIRKLKRRIDRGVFRDRPGIEFGMRMFMRDEISHARIGHTWLRYVLPNPADRRAAIDEARLLRGVLLLTSVAHHGGRPLGALLSEYGTETNPDSGRTRDA